MARDVESFKTLRNNLSESLDRCYCVPQDVNEKGVATAKIEQHFLPAGSAKEVLRFTKLERLFAFVKATDYATTLDLEPSDLARRIEERGLHDFLAVLIISNCDIDALRSFIQQLVVPEPWGPTQRQRAKLPINNREVLRAILGDDAAARSFFHNQFDFDAPIIEKNKEKKGNFRRVPYVSQKLIGEGSFGRVYKVVISPHHFRDEHGLSNPEKLVLARKDFELSDTAYEKERDVLREIVRNVKNNNNIMESWGSLQIGSTYSLFMPLADCDLHRYMETHPSPPDSFKNKAKLVQCAVGLAGAILYLHEELETPNYEKLSCFHMDLKPQNILVIDRNGQQQWKLSDFNMSRVKGQRKISSELVPPSRSATFYEINNLFKQKKPDITNSFTESTVNRRGAGTYLAPEACLGYPLHAESDIWSLGCVMSVVLTYLHGGYAAVEEFSDLRSKKSHDSFDRFFTLSRGKELCGISDVRINDGVLRWFRRLRTESNKSEKLLFANLTRFLMANVFIVKPADRRGTKASHIREKLVDAFQVYSGMSEASAKPPSAPKSPSRILDIFRPPRTSKTGLSLRSLGPSISLATPIRACMFGPDAQPLICVTDRELVAYSVHHVSSADDMDNIGAYGTASPHDKGRLWTTNVDVSTQLIIAATDHHEFDCYFYHIPDSGSPLSELELVAHWEIDLPKISKLAISSDAQYAAFILPSNVVSDPNASLYIVRLDGLNSTRVDRKVYSIISTSSGSSSTPDSSLGRAISLPCPAEDICELTFSHLNSLYAVSKPRHVRHVTKNSITVFAWNLIEGKRLLLEPSTIEHDGKDDIFQGLFTTFAPYNQQLAFAIISQKNTIITRTWTTTPYTQSTAPGYRILHILMSLDDRTLLAFGTNQTSNAVHLLKVTGITTREEADVKTLGTFSGLTHRNVLWASTTPSSSGHENQRDILVAAIVQGSVQLFRVPLDP